MCDNLAFRTAPPKVWLVDARASEAVYAPGLSTILIAVAALIRGPAVVRSWLDRQAADAEEARARAEALRAEAGERRLERRRTVDEGEYTTPNRRPGIRPVLVASYCGVRPRRGGASL
jgi:hypothetical protein